MSHKQIMALLALFMDHYKSDSYEDLLTVYARLFFTLCAKSAIRSLLRRAIADLTKIVPCDKLGDIPAHGV